MKSAPKSLAIAYSIQRKNKPKMAHGGPVSPMSASPSDTEEHYESIADAILAKKRKAKFADGGMVDLDENAEEASANPNTYDDQNELAAMKENYDEGMDGVIDPMDSNEHGDELSDEDSHDMVDSIRKKYKAKKGM